MGATGGPPPAPTFPSLPAWTWPPMGLDHSWHFANAGYRGAGQTVGVLGYFHND